jgi:hypothetical protein
LYSHKYLKLIADKYLQREYLLFVRKMLIEGVYSNG